MYSEVVPTEQFMQHIYSVLIFTVITYYVMYTVNNTNIIDYGVNTGGVQFEVLGLM